MMKRYKSVLITVNYRTADSTIRFLQSISQLDAFDQNLLIVVDNASGDGSANQIRGNLGGSANRLFLESNVNRGYFGGAKWALEKAVGTGSLPDWVIISNNDITFQDKQFFTKLFRRDPQALGVLAPAIVSRLTGIDSNPFLRKRPTPWQVFPFRFLLSQTRQRRILGQ